MQSDPEFEAVRQITDPLAQARAAGELIGVYQQRSTELSRIRKEAMNAAVAQRGITFTELAKELGLTKGRVSQIRSSAPPTERGLFGVGPLTIAIPQRALGGRPEGVISAHDTAAADHLQHYLESPSFRTTRYLIPTTGDVPPIESLLIEVPDPDGPFGANGPFAGFGGAYAGGGGRRSSTSRSTSTNPMRS